MGFTKSKSHERRCNRQGGLLDMPRYVDLMCFAGLSVPRRYDLSLLKLTQCLTHPTSMPPYCVSSHSASLSPACPGPAPLLFHPHSLTRPPQHSTCLTRSCGLRPPHSLLSLLSLSHQSSPLLRSSSTKVAFSSRSRSSRSRLIMCPISRSEVSPI